jgi:hypothetical protein
MAKPPEPGTHIKEYLGELPECLHYIGGGCSRDKVRSSESPAWREESDNRSGVCQLEPKNEGRRSELRLVVGLLSLDEEGEFVGVV